MHLNSNYFFLFSMRVYISQLVKLIQEGKMSEPQLLALVESGKVTEDQIIAMASDEIKPLDEQKNANGKKVTRSSKNDLNKKM